MFLSLCFLIFSNAYSQRIVKSAMNKYSSCFNDYYYFSRDYVFDRTFTLADKSIVAISTNRHNYFVTKWNKNLDILDKAEIVLEAHQYIYYSFIVDDIVYLFSLQDKDNQRIYSYYTLSFGNKITIQQKFDAFNGYVVLYQNQFIYMLNADNCSIQKVNITTLESERISIPVQNTAKKMIMHVAKNGYILLIYSTYNSAKSKDPSNSVIENFIFEAKTDKVNKVPIDFIFDDQKRNDIDIAINNDSIYFLTYSNKKDHLILDYKILGYDFGSNNTFVSKKSSVILTKDFYHRYLSTSLFSVDPISGNLILVLDRFNYITTPSEKFDPGKPEDYPNAFPLNGGFNQSYVYYLTTSKVYMDYPIVVLNSKGDVVSIDFMYYPQNLGGAQNTVKIVPKIFFIDGLLYCFVSNFKMTSMNCFIYTLNGVAKDNIRLFKDDDVMDTFIVNTSTIYYIGSGLFVFGTVPDRCGKPGNYYMFKVNK
jgi:hypothetical protein